MRLLDLHDHIGPRKYFFGGVKNGGAGGHIIGIGKSRANARSGLNDNLMAMCHGLMRGVGGHAHAKFLWFDLFWATDFHDEVLLWTKSARKAVQLLGLFQWRIALTFANFCKNTPIVRRLSRVRAN